MILSRLVKPRARRSADIVDSVPDDTARTISIDGTASRSVSANFTSISVGAPNVVPIDIVSAMVSRISRCVWPRISGPQLPIRSMYLLPSASMMYAPSPWTTKIGSAPTERHARTGELTPPGITACARSKMAWLRSVDIARTYTIVIRRRDAQPHSAGDPVRRVVCIRAATPARLARADAPGALGELEQLDGARRIDPVVPRAEEARAPDQ